MLKPLRLLPPLVIVISLLTGCVPANSDPAPVVVVTCPTLIEYDQATLNRLANEIDAQPGGSLLPVFMMDYAALRAQVRACRDAKHPER